MLKKYLVSTLIAMCFVSFAAAQSSKGRLAGRVVIITGGSKGIGKGIAERFLEEGAKIVICGRTAEALRKTQQELKKPNNSIIYVVADVSKLADMQNLAKQTVSKFGRIDVLVHNAAVLLKAAPIDQMTAEEWQLSISNNLTGVFNAVKAVLPQMKQQQYGRIVFTSSISGPYVGLQTKSHYTAAKGGMEGFMRTIAIELVKYNITVNAVAPGNVMTEGLRINSPEVIANRTKAIPMGRLGELREIANAHLFFASDESSYITGQSLVVDGGQVLPEDPFSEF